MSSTQEYVANAYLNREGYAELIVKLLDGESLDNNDKLRDPIDGYDDVHDYLSEAYALSVECGFGRPLEILLSTGGPGEWISATLDSDGDVASAEFWAVWGSERARRDLSSTSALYRIAEYYAESFKS